MNVEERTKSLEEEFQKTKEELDQILLDIRTYILEVQNPMKRFERRGAEHRVPEGR